MLRGLAVQLWWQRFLGMSARTRRMAKAQVASRQGLRANSQAISMVPLAKNIMPKVPAGGGHIAEGIPKVDNNGLQ